MPVGKVTERYIMGLAGVEGSLNSILPVVGKPDLPEPPRLAAGPEKEPGQSNVSVYVRVRPLVEDETQAGIGIMPGMVTTSSDPGDSSATALQTDKVNIGGFTGVLGTEADNETMFRHCFKSRLDTVVAGGTASLFCYGYTGSGKSHTVLGYGGEKGLYHLAAGDLLARMEEQYPGENLFLVATASEIYGDTVYDLMGEEKLPASLRTDADGNLCVCGPAVKNELSDLVGEFKPLDDSSLGKSARATIVTRTRGLRCGLVRTIQDLDTISTSALQLRVVGSSTEHSQSSRSHAVLRMEVMNMETYKAKEAMDDAKVLLPAMLNAIENHWTECFNKLVDTKSGRRDDGSYTFGLMQYEGGQEEWDKVYASLEIKKKQLEAAIPSVMERVQQAYQQLEQVKYHEAVGGALVLVDLAGADYDKRDVGTTTTAQQKKESTDINKSLLALKECFRYIAGVNGAGGHGPFRGSKLTRLLEDSLLPGAHSTRKNRACASVMVVNVSPAEHIAKRTLNVLRYGQIFADGSKKTEKTSKHRMVQKKRIATH
eukprot:GFUD01009497.1.p1 GENE.GFUD01009497.1~~GFUD01009497.1.p1  ORF type:complete len:542 (+),score=132.52 GFUD01009497.1:171-1796(+)